MKKIIGWIMIAFLTRGFTNCEEPVSAPSDLTVVFVSPSEVKLTWKDNSHNENAFWIFLKTVPQDDDFVFIGIVDANITTFNDTGLISGTHYIYKVCSSIWGTGWPPTPESCSNEVEVTGQ